MAQHMIAIDLDGTTLNNESKLTDLTISTLRQLDEMGHLVIIVTGRPYRTSKHLYQQLNIQNGLINFNGALCHFPGRPHWQPTYHEELDREIAFELFANQDTLDIDLLMAEGRNQLYSTSMNMPDSPYDPLEHRKATKLTRESLIDNPTALTIFSAPEKHQLIENNIMNRYGDYVSVRTWGGPLPVLEVVRAGINKAVSVDHLAQFYHIPNKNILAFGDENNDLEMLQYAGLGVAMKNATEEVKGVADTVTNLTNHEDGLAHFLIDYFELKPAKHHS